MSISILIITLNEEENLPSCLDSLSWSDDIVVLDSHSTDRTLDIARSAGARIYQRAFDGERNQRAYGLHEIPFKYRWVYMPDADETTPSELRDEMLAIAGDPNRSEVAFRTRFKTLFMGRWVRHSSLYPTWVVRLVRPEKIRFERDIHLRCMIDGPEGKLKSHFLHHSFRRGLNAWYDKHNRYSWNEAHEAIRSLCNDRLDWAGMLSFRDSVRRRRAIKELSFRLPFRPALRFSYMYILRGGFLDGWPGYMYCRLIAAYEYMIVVKMAEIRRRDEGLPV